MNTATKCTEIRVILDCLNDYKMSEETLFCDICLSDQSVSIADEFTSL